MARLAMDDPFFVAKALKWYKRPEVQQAILTHCEGREVAPRFGEGFGKRPDVLLYPGDVLQLAMQRATSFHCSEERWRDPLQLKTGAPRRELDGLRTGWDLVLDIDCPQWRLAKSVAHLFVAALKAHGVRSISVKFSGSKGFHIGVPFEAFPAEHLGQPTAALFPEAPRAIARHLLQHISEELVHVTGNVIIFDRRYKIGFDRLRQLTGKDADELLVRICRRCRSPKRAAAARTFLCSSCGRQLASEDAREYVQCACGGVMELQAAPGCVCGAEEFDARLDVSAIVEVDTVLLASRHLFRAPYSLHEKSGLVSVVLSPDGVMGFEKGMARPEAGKAFPRFLDPAGAIGEEGAALLAAAMSHVAEEKREHSEIRLPDEAIPEELFPPCMQGILNGLVDGKKRAMFALTNFLRSCGWGPDEVTARLEEWNKQNPEPLREVTVKGHARYAKARKEVVFPPNCKSFYQDIRVCKPDGFCPRIKNPAQYARRKMELRDAGKGPAQQRPRLTEEQKAMRKAYRERKKSSQ